MNRMKGIIGILIFVCLFAGAWALDDHMKREQRSIKMIDRISEKGLLKDLEEGYPNTIEIRSTPEREPFNPREYIRIRRRTE